MAEDVDYGRLMGTLIKSLDALAAEQRGVNQALLSSLGTVKEYSGSTTTARHARRSIQTLAGGTDAGAGQTASTGAGPGVGGPQAPPPDPGAGRLGTTVPKTVEEARGTALASRTGMIMGALGWRPGGTAGSVFNLLAGTTARPGAGHPAPGSAGQAAVPAAGGTGAVGSNYMLGYGYYSGLGTPYGAGGYGGGGGRPMGGIPPSGGGGGHGSGGHLGLLGSVASRVPVVGLGVRGVEELLSQRDKNAYYQNVEGGGNAAGFAERAHEEAYRWGTAGLFSSSEARESFKGVTRIGYNSKTAPGGGPTRQEALNFVYHGKSSYGATVDESLMTLQEASKTTQLSLKDLSGELKGLSDVAGRAGTNAQMARSQMVGLMSQAIGSGYGGGSASAASSIQTTLASYGRSYADTSAAGQLSSGYARYAAAQAGMTYGQLTTLQKRNPAAAAAVRTGVGLQGAAQVLTPAMQSFLSGRIKDYGGQVDEAVSLQISSDFMARFGSQVDPEVITGQLSALTGMQFSDADHAIGWVAQQMAGNTEANRAKNAAPSDYTGLGKISTGQAMAQGIWSPAQALFGNKGANRAIASGGKVDPVLAALAKAVPDIGSETVMVHTASGPRVVSLAEAMAKHPNELASGQVRFTSLFGKESGKTVSDLLGGKIDSSRDWSSEAAAADTSGVAASQNFWGAVNTIKSTAAANPASGQHITIDLSDDARKLLRVASTSGATGAAGEAAPPVNTYALNPSANR